MWLQEEEQDKQDEEQENPASVHTGGFAEFSPIISSKGIIMETNSDEK